MGDETDYALRGLAPTDAQHKSHEAVGGGIEDLWLRRT